MIYLQVCKTKIFRGREDDCLCNKGSVSGRGETLWGGGLEVRSGKWGVLAVIMADISRYGESGTVLSWSFERVVRAGRLIGMS